MTEELSITTAVQRSLRQECLPFLVPPGHLLDYLDSMTPTMDLLHKVKRIKLRLQAMVLEEMECRAMEYQLWTNSQCRAWDDYQHAERTLTRYRKDLEV